MTNETSSITICGVPYSIVLEKDNFDADLHYGQVDYKTCTIRINEDIAKELQFEALCHEMLHAILVHIGRNEMSQDEEFVQSLANAINQSFVPKKGDMSKLTNIDNRELTNMWHPGDGCNLEKTTIKVRYVALLEVEDEIEENDSTLTANEIRQNARSGMIENGLRDLIAGGFCKPKITITQQLVDVIDTETKGE